MSNSNVNPLLYPGASHLHLTGQHLADTIGSLNVALAATQADLEHLLEHIAHLDKVIADGTRENQRISADLIEAQGQVISLHHELDSAQAARDELMKANQSLADQVGAARAEQALLASGNADLRATIEGMSAGQAHSKSSVAL